LKDPRPTGERGDLLATPTENAKTAKAFENVRKQPLLVKDGALIALRNDLDVPGGIKDDFQSEEDAKAREVYLKMKNEGQKAKRRKRPNAAPEKAIQIIK
jgi:hypothetical protein